MNRNTVMVVGSINMDLVVRTDRTPSKGETVLGYSFDMIPGGKGANQAWAVLKQNNEVIFVGRTGEDTFGQTMLKNMKEAGMSCDRILQSGDTATGTAFITIDGSGDNRIIVVPGANNLVSTADTAAAFAEYGKRIRAVVLQMEIPLETVFASIKLAAEYGVPVFLNAAPAHAIPEELLPLINFLIVNETELAFISGKKVTDAETAEKAAKIFTEKKVSCVLVTLGAHGALAVTDKNTIYSPPLPAKVVDTTAAGDSFIGGFVSEYLAQEGATEAERLTKALRRGNACGALATTVMGAQTSIPVFNQVNEYLTSLSQ